MQLVRVNWVRGVSITANMTTRMCISIARGEVEWNKTTAVAQCVSRLLLVTQLPVKHQLLHECLRNILMMQKTVTVSLILVHWLE